MTTQDSDNVKAIKALEDVEKHLQDVSARMQRGDQWVWHRDGVTLIDDLGPHGFHAATERAAKAIEEAAHLFVVYLETLGKVPPRFKAVFRQAAVLLNRVALLEHQHGAEYRFVRALQSLQRMKTDFQEYFCTPPVKAKKRKSKSEAATRLQSQELQDVKAELVAAGIIVDGRWAKDVSDFSCLATELKETFGIVADGKQNGNTRYAWKDYAHFAGFPADKKSLESARSCSQYNQHGEIANKIRAICKKVHAKYC